MSETVEDDEMTQEARDLRDRMAAPNWQGGDCEHGELSAYRVDGENRAECRTCGLVYVERDATAEAVSRIESRMAAIQGMTQGFLESATVGLKGIAASPVGAMLGLDPDSLPALPGFVSE